MTSLKDVAAIAGVSVRTVSRVLGKDERVSGTTRKRVLEVAARLGYRPNWAARTLKTGRSSEISAVIGNLDQLHVEKLSSFERVLRKAGFSVHVFFGPTEAASPDEVAGVLHEVIERRPAAVAVFPFSFLPAYRTQAYFEHHRIHHVFLDPMERHDVDAIWIDRQQGVYEATKYLWESGKRHIAYMGVMEGLPSDPRFFAASTRMEGYERAMREIGQSLVVLPMELGVDEYRGGKEAIRAFLELSPRPDAVQTYTDEMAVGFLSSLHDEGIKVPEEVAVIGFNDTAYAKFAWPPLTTIAQPNHGVGEAAAEVLLRKIHGEPTPENGWSQILPTRLVRRQTA